VQIVSYRNWFDTRYAPNFGRKGKIILRLLNVDSHYVCVCRRGEPFQLHWPLWLSDWINSNHLMSKLPDLWRLTYATSGSWRLTFGCLDGVNLSIAGRPLPKGWLRSKHGRSTTQKCFVRLWRIKRFLNFEETRKRFFIRANHHTVPQGFETHFQKVATSKTIKYFSTPLPVKLWNIRNHCIWGIFF